MSKAEQNGSNTGWFGSVLFLVFLVLKLVGVIAWSWWWVTAPLWGPVVLALIAVALVAVGSAVAVRWVKK